MFQQAARKGDVALIQSSIQLNGENDRESLSLAFMTAAKYGHVNILQYLWEHHCISSIDIVEPVLNRGAMSIACNHGHLECVTFLLSMGANLNHQDCHGMTPLMICCSSGRRALVQVLLNAGADRDIVAHDAHHKKAIDFCTSHPLREMLLTAATAMPLQYEIAKAYPIFLRYREEMGRGEDDDTLALHSLQVSFLQFPSTKNRCIRPGKAVSCHAANVTNAANANAATANAATANANVATVDIVLKCTTDRSGLERELRLLQELQKQWQQQRQQQQGSGLRVEDDGPFICPLSDMIVVFREVHGSHRRSNNSNSNNNNSSSSSSSNSIGEQEREEVGSENEWFGMILEKGACDLHCLGFALAQSFAKTPPSSPPPPSSSLQTKGTSSQQLARRHGRIVLYLAEECCKIVRAIHRAGRVWCDCKPANFVAFFQTSPSSISTTTTPPPSTAATVLASSIENASKSHQSPTPLHLAQNLLNGNDSYMTHTTLKAIDLGGCKLAGTTVSATEMSCTVRFLAPEVARVLVREPTCGDSYIAVDPKLDAWSLGVTLFQLVHPTFQTLCLSTTCSAEDAVAEGGGHSHKQADLTLLQLASTDLIALQAAVDACIDALAAHVEAAAAATAAAATAAAAAAASASMELYLHPSTLEEEQTPPPPPTTAPPPPPPTTTTTANDAKEAAGTVHLVLLIRSLLRVNPEERATVSQAMDSLWKEK